MINILFISPYKTLKNIGWQELQLSTMKDKIVAYAHNDVTTSGNLYNLNSIINKIANKVIPKVNIEFLFPYLLKHIVDKHGCEVVICNFLDFSVRFKKFITQSKIPFLIFCHGREIIWDYKDATTGNYQYNSNFFEELESIKDKAFFVANSSFTKKKLEEVGISSSRIFIKYFGVDYTTPKIINSSDKGMNVLYVGRLIECKGPVESIKAFIRAREIGFKGRLTMIGDGVLWNECVAIAMNSKYKDDIFFMGSLPYNEVLQQYEKSDIVIAHHQKDSKTNQEEAFGVSILEAFSQGLPVITGNSGGVTDIIQDGYNGFVVEPGDIDKQSEILFQMYKDIALYNSMSTNCIETIKSNFSKEQDVLRLNQILNSVLFENTIINNTYA